jgi:UDP-glucose 4-epimerase
LAETLADSVGRRDLLSVGSLAGRAGDPPVLYADVERLTTEVKFLPAWKQRPALQETVNWWRTRLASHNDHGTSPTGPEDD